MFIPYFSSSSSSSIVSLSRALWCEHPMMLFSIVDLGVTPMSWRKEEWCGFLKIDLIQFDLMKGGIVLFIALTTIKIEHDWTFGSMETGLPHLHRIEIKIIVYSKPLTLCLSCVTLSQKCFVILLFDMLLIQMRVEHKFQLIYSLRLMNRFRFWFISSIYVHSLSVINLILVESFSRHKCSFLLTAVRSLRNFLSNFVFVFHWTTCWCAPNYFSYFAEEMNEK